jgi:hypothetical protein
VMARGGLRSKRWLWKAPAAPGWRGEGEGKTIWSKHAQRRRSPKRAAAVTLLHDFGEGGGSPMIGLGQEARGRSVAQGLMEGEVVQGRKFDTVMTGGFQGASQWSGAGWGSGTGHCHVEGEGGPRPMTGRRRPSSSNPTATMKVDDGWTRCYNVGRRSKGIQVHLNEFKFKENSFKPFSIQTRPSRA